MRQSILFGIFAMLIIAGCVSPPTEAIPSSPAGPSEPSQECTIVMEERPVIEEECGNVSFTEQICGLRTLEYSTASVPKVDLCIADGACVGEPLGKCLACSKAMTRCMLILTNDDDKTGTWTVSASYMLGTSGFTKEPITAAIRPGESYTYDFFQIYVPGQPINSASCELTVTNEAIIDDCHEETRTGIVCRNVTRTVLVETEVCQ